MTAATFVKHYDDPRRAAAAHAHHAWLTDLDSGMRLPTLLTATATFLEFEHLGHRHPGPDDLPALADSLGALHAAAHTTLRGARLDEPFTTTTGLVITDFITPRRAWLKQLPLPTAGVPVALYKDANIRNFLLTDHGPALVDFDDLTLAPFGYDLAKLLISTAMTHGRLNPETITEALTIYNTATASATCDLHLLRQYIEFHHLCTARYLHSNGYRHAWPDVTPWTLTE